MPVKWITLRNDLLLTGAVSAWVHKDGSFADMMKEETGFYRSEMRIPEFTVEETSVEVNSLAGTCIIWDDIGRQLGDKGLRVLKGENPGDIAWDYPRKYNIMVNLAEAKRLGIAIPKQVLDAAYRVFTDYDGNFIGKK